MLRIIRTDGSYLGAPSSDETLHAGDTLLAYGRERQLWELSKRKRGDQQARKPAIEDYIQVTGDADLSSYP